MALSQVVQKPGSDISGGLEKNSGAKSLEDDAQRARPRGSKGMCECVALPRTVNHEAVPLKVD